MRGASFLFAFQNKFQIYGESDIFFAESVERGEDGDDWGFVVGRGAGVDTPIVRVGACSRWIRKRDGFAAGFDGVVTQDGSEGGLVGPGRGIDGLAVIV